MATMADATAPCSGISSRGLGRPSAQTTVAVPSTAPRGLAPVPAKSHSRLLGRTTAPAPRALPGIPGCVRAPQKWRSGTNLAAASRPRSGVPATSNTFLNLYRNHPSGTSSAAPCAPSGVPAFSSNGLRHGIHGPGFSMRLGSASAPGAALELPPIDGDLSEALLDSGADVDDHGVALTFGNDDAAVAAAYSGVAVYNMTHFGRIRVSGDDRIRFLHNQTTADFNSLKAGQGCFTVFVTPTARTIDLGLAWIMDRAVILTVSPSERQKFLTMMDRYIFPADKVQLTDITDKTCQLALVGSAGDQVLERFGVKGLEGAPLGTHRHFSVDGSPATAAVGSGLALPGYTFLLAADVAGQVWSSLLEAGVVPMGEVAWNRLRVVQGRPAPGAELTNDYNPLEAGLWEAISTNKGCYMGQETIARLITYNGVKQHLWGVQFQSAVEQKTTLLDKTGQKIGKVTSCVLNSESAEAPFAALAYVKRTEPAVQAGMEVFADGVKGSLKEVPFSSRNLPAAQ